MIGGSGWKDLGAPQFLTLWWATWIVGGILGNIAARMWFSNDTLEDLRSADWVDIASSGVSIAAAALGILVVRRLTARQQLRARLVAEHAATRPPIAYDPRSRPGIFRDGPPTNRPS